jgi:DNA-binding CsgD family transcriptional regulator
MSQPRIWERAEAVAAVQGLLTDARGGQGRSLFIVGEAGLGKTTMLERAQALATESGLRLGIGRGDAAESNLPFGIMDQALRMLGYGSDPKPNAQRSGLDARSSEFYATLQFLEESSPPTLILLDDLHWADEDSLALLTFLGRRVGALPIAFLGTLRPWPRAALDAAERLASSGDAGIERLLPLSDESAAALLIDRAGGALSPASARRAARLVAGNPLLLEQVAASVRRNQRIPRLTGDPHAVEHSLLLARFTGVSAAERRYAEAACILGIRFRPAVAGQLADLAPSDAAVALEGLCRGGLFAEEIPGWARFAHPLLRQALYDQIPGPVRARRHTQAFRLLHQAAAVDPTEAAEQAARGDLAGDSDAVAVLWQAGRAAMQAGAISRARQRLEAAVDLAGSHVTPELLIELGEVLMVGGDGQAAVRTFRRLLADPGLPGHRRAAARRMLGRALFISGTSAEADAAFRAAIAETARTDSEEAVEALLDQAFIAWPTGGPARAAPLLEQARALVPTVSAGLQLRVDTAWGFTAFIRGDAAGIQVVEAAAPHAFANPEADTVDFGWSWGTLGTYGNLAKWSERFAEATRAYQAGMEAAERMGLPVAIAALAVMHADTCLRTGDLPLAAALADRAVLLADLAPERAFWAAVTHAYIAADFGDMEDCGAWFQRARDLADPDQQSAGWVWLLHLEAVIAMHLRRTAEACGIIDRLRALAERLELREPCVVPWTPAAITAYMYGGRFNDAQAVIASLETMAERLPCRFPRVVALGGRAAFTQAAGDLPATQRLLEEAIGLAAESGMRMLESRLRHRLGAFLYRSGQPAPARPHLARALELAEACGAEKNATAVAGLLQEAGGRRRARIQNPDELTPAEARVRWLAAQGLRPQQIADQLFRSINTVETHLQRIYRKLGISSQRELIMLSRQGTATPADRSRRFQPEYAVRPER